VEQDWLDTRHTFSFGHYHDPGHMGFHALRVINEDVIAPGQGFGKHFHDDMEIITYVTDGELAHKDNTGGGGIIRRGDVQRMSAGRGIIHSEFNHSKEHPVRLLQIWIVPKAFAIDPSYEQKNYPDAAKRAKLLLIASGDGRGGSLAMSQDADVYASILEKGEEVSLALAAGRHAWVQVVSGRVDLNGLALDAGDGAAIDDEEALRIAAKEGSEFLVFDLP
jgi:redox-sensitive bicupin YhaK (pirin superfamily)